VVQWELQLFLQITFEAKVTNNHNEYFLLLRKALTTAELKVLYCYYSLVQLVLFFQITIEVKLTNSQNRSYTNSDVGSYPLLALNVVLNVGKVIKYY
jgi:hypothetical protein